MSIRFYRALYGSHPYAEPITGTNGSIKKITTQHLKKFRDEFLVSQNMNIALTGQLSVKQAQKLAERAGKTLPPFQAECINQIPLSSGLGSSAATILTGLLAGNALLENPLSTEQILNLASEMEGHPDNVAPALLGGLVVSTMEAGQVIAITVHVEIDARVLQQRPGLRPRAQLDHRRIGPPPAIVLAEPVVRAPE